MREQNMVTVVSKHLENIYQVYSRCRRVNFKNKKKVVGVSRSVGAQIVSL